MVIALCIANAYYFGLHARGEPHCDSHPECSLSIFDLFHFLFFQKVHSDETCPSYSLFLCSLCFLPCIACCHGKYIGSRRATKIWICCWIYFQIRTMLSGGILLPLPFSFLPSLELNSRKRMALGLLASCHLT